MPKQHYSVRVMSRKEVDMAVEWAAAEGWNPGWHDADCFYAADPAGFLVGLLDDEPVATLSAVKYGNSFGFLGFYIVKPEHRGRGYGLQIWNAALASLKGRVIGLDGVVAQQNNYKKSGFELAHRNIRYQGIGGGKALTDARIVPVNSLSLDEVLAYDRAFFPADRTVFLSCWLQQSRSVALGYVRNGKLMGYGMLRACRTGQKIGPLFADDEEVAEALFAALQAQAPAGAPIFLDAPEVNPAAIDLARRHGMTVSFETARMYTGKRPELPLNRLYGVTTFELG